jgi:hypothetical protein
MDPITLALIGAGVGALQSNEERNRWKDQQMAEAEKTRYGAFTGLHGENLKPPTGDMNHMFAGAATGYALGQKAGSVEKGSDKAASESGGSEGAVFGEPSDDLRSSDNYYKRQKAMGIGNSDPSTLYS